MTLFSLYLNVSAIHSYYHESRWFSSASPVTVSQNMMRCAILTSLSIIQNSFCILFLKLNMLVLFLISECVQ